MRPGRLLLIAFAVLSLLGATVGVTFAAFSATTSNPASSFAAKRIFPNPRATSPHDLRDASSGSEANVSEPVAFSGDGLAYTTISGVSTGSNRIVDVDYESARPPGLSASGVQVSVTFYRGSGTGNACYWFEARRASTNALLGTHGSYGAQIGCSSGTTPATFATSLSEITTTDDLNDLRIRLYPWETTGGKVTFDRVTVTGSDAYASFTLYDTQISDSTPGTTTTVTPWSLETAADGATYTSGSSWAVAPNTSKYLKATFDLGVPTGAVVTSATLTHSAQPANTLKGPANLCFYFDVYNGATLLATHGSGASPVACNNTYAWTTDTISLPEVNTVAKANGLKVLIYYFENDCGSSGNSPRCGQSITDRLNADVTYYLN